VNEASLTRAEGEGFLARISTNSPSPAQAGEGLPKYGMNDRVGAETQTISPHKN